MAPNRPFHRQSLLSGSAGSLPAPPWRAGRPRFRGFTLVELLAALLLMAIIIPVAMQGVSVASRAGVLGQRKAAAMRVADRVLNEIIVTGDSIRSSSSGTVTEGNAAYPWTLDTQTWPEDAMLQLTVTVTYTAQGNPYQVSLSTLIDPTAPAPVSSPDLPIAQ
jgi:prepilin-type N-terminal cleavage/methylation domain-containing protein